MYKEVVPVQKAEEEVSAWLDSKKIKPKEREKNEAFINTLVEAVTYGILTIDDDTKVITQNLEFPLSNTDKVVTLSSLRYNPRADTGSLHGKTANIKGIGMAVYVAYASALTGELVATLNKLDSEDFKVLQAITAFFL